MYSYTLMHTQCTLGYGDRRGPRQGLEGSCRGWGYSQVVSTPLSGSLLSSPITEYTLTWYWVRGLRLCRTTVFSVPSTNTCWQS